jgi:hypothetical protein
MDCILRADLIRKYGRKASMKWLDINCTDVNELIERVGSG